MLRYLHRWAWPVVAVALLGMSGDVRLPSGFIDASMEWDFRNESPQGDIHDEGYCSTRLDILGNGKIRATHRYERKLTKVTRQYDARNQFESEWHGMAVFRTYRDDSTSKEPLPALSVQVEYPSIVRLVPHRDGSVTAIFRPQLKAVRLAHHKLEWLVDRKGEVMQEKKHPVELEQHTCDAIDKFQSALQARHGTLGAFPTMKDTATVNSMYTPAIPAQIRGKWDLRN